jgi:hypothetical protein
MNSKTWPDETVGSPGSGLRIAGSATDQQPSNRQTQLQGHSAGYEFSLVKAPSVTAGCGRWGPSHHIKVHSRPEASTKDPIY